MNPFERQVELALRDPLAEARRHAAQGGRVVGYVGGDIPVEIIIASGAFPLRLPSFAQRNTAAADQFLESGFAPDVRSIAEQYLRGDFDFLEGIVLPRSNDSAQRLYYYLCELRTRRGVTGPDVLIFDLAKIPRESSRMHSRAAVCRLAAELRADPGQLRGAIQTRNRRRALWAKASARRLQAGGAPGSAMDRVLRSAEWCDAGTFDPAFEAWLAAAAPGAARPRLILAGSVPPDERLHREAESAGGNIVAEWGDHPGCGIGGAPIAPDGSFAAIADHYHGLGSGTRAFVDRATEVLGLARAACADGVLIWLIEQEDALIWDLPSQTAALRAAGIAVLPMARRPWDGPDAAAGIADFTRSLGVGS